MLEVMTQHAAARANQRGIPHNLVEAVLDNADVETPVGGGCVAYTVSRRRLEDRDVRRQLGGDIDRASKVAVICSDDGAIVTVMHDWGGQGRRYRGRC